MRRATLDKNIVNFPGYTVDTLGDIWSFRRPGPGGFLNCYSRKLKAFKNAQGYSIVTLMSNGKKYNKRVHRLVLEAFRGQCPVGMEGCHLNGIKDDNSLRNLAWNTPTNNCSHKVNHGTNSKKLTAKDVGRIRALSSIKSREEIAEMFGISAINVYFIITKRTWRRI